MNNPGRRARNLDLCNAYGINAGLCSIRDRLSGQKRTPLWLLTALNDLIERSNHNITPLQLRRDELQR